jgi:Dolichyl-phosphate-mannose-protein mannosyltransferase
VAELAVGRPSAIPVLASRRVESTYLGRFDAAFALSLGAVALLLRLHDLGHESLWLDEGYSLLFSHLPLLRIFIVGGAHEHPPLYYLLVHAAFWVRDSYLTPRVIAALAGSGSVLALYLLGTRIYGRTAGLIASSLLLLSPFHIWYSRDGRAYELAGLFVLLSYLTLLDVPVARNRPARGLYVLFTVLALYTEYTTILVLLPQALFIFKDRQPGSAMRHLRSWGAIALLFAPWLGVVVLDFNSIANNYWIPAPNLSAFGATVLEFFGLLTPCPSPHCAGTELGIPGLAGHEGIAGMVVAVIIVFALGAAVVTRKVTSTVLLLWMSLPFALILFLAHRRSLYLDRVFLDATFPMYLLAGAGVNRLRHHLLKAGVVIFCLSLLTIGALQLPALYAGVSTPDWKSPARDLAAAYRPGQQIVYYPGVVGALVHAYVPPSWQATGEKAVWLQNYLDIPNWRAQLGKLTDSELRDRELGAAARGHRQVWLVAQGYTGLALARRWFVGHGFHIAVGETYYGGTRIELFDRGPVENFGPPVIADLHSSRNPRMAGTVLVKGDQFRLRGASSVDFAFGVRSAQAYSVDLQYQATPPVFSRVTVRVYDSNGHLLDTFPRTKWYDLPVTGVWLEQPFGFVTAPGSAQAILELRNIWGWSAWRHVAIYRETAGNRF